MNLLVVSKPFDIDQVMSNKEVSEGNQNIWLVLNSKTKNFANSLKYLGELEQKNIVILKSPVFSDLFLNSNFSSKYFIKVEHGLIAKNEKPLNLLVFFHHVIRFAFKLSSFMPAYLYWIGSYLNYKKQLGDLKINVIYTQAWVSKLLPLITVSFNKLVFYDGGRSSSTTKDKENFMKYGSSFLLSRAMDDKRNFAMPAFLRNKIDDVSNKESSYVNSLKENSSSSYYNLGQKPVNKNFLLIAGSFEVIDERFYMKIQEVLSTTDKKLDNYNLFVYRPHPRRILSYQEKNILERFKFMVKKTYISLESDLLNDKIISQELPSTIVIQNSSAALVLKQFLPKEVDLIERDLSNT